MVQNQYIRLETKGRKSGKPHQVLLRYVSVGTKIVVFPSKAGVQAWLLNVQSNSNGRLFFQDRVLNCTADVKKISGLDDPLLGIFTRKYGRDIVDQYYIGQHTYVELLVRESASANLDEIIYGDLEAAFDGVAEDYDRHIFGNPINTWLRNVSIAVMNGLFRPGDTVLEIGCGTGTETLSLARRGVRVIATDISSKMVEVLNSKARKSGLSEKVIGVWSRPVDLAEKVRKLGFARVDGAYSTYGAVNTEPRLPEMTKVLHCILKENAPLVLGVWNKYCLFEILGYSFKLRPSLAFARLRNPVQVGKSRFCVATNAFSVGSLGKVVNPYFELKKVYGVVITLPPSNLTRYLPGNSFFSLLKAVDMRIGSSFPMNRLGDHFLAVYKRRTG
ncbi:MAG: methyltransferase domain-containing protein [Nitrososphaerales archaeon]